MFTTTKLALNCLIFLTSIFGVSAQFTPRFIPSKKTTHKIPKEQKYTFGYLEVLEDRNQSTGRTIKLPVYIFKSRSKTPQPDPIIYTVGGPGSSTMPSAQYMKYYQYLDDRDFILIEQRGTRYAKPHLDCPEWAKVNQLANLPQYSQATIDSLYQAAAKTCKKRLEKQKINLNCYTTQAIATDIEDLRKVLNISEYNLLTISYSTKIAQVLLRDYPNSIRSVVMDSPLPLEVNYDEESCTNLLEAVDKLLSDCAADSTCNAIYPDLKRRFYNYLKEKSRSPLKVSVVHPKKGTTETFYLKGKDLITVFTAASTNQVAGIPAKIDQLLNKDLKFVKAQLLQLFSPPSSGHGIGMRLSVWCAEELPFADPQIIQEETNKYPEIEGLSPAVFDPAICEIWSVQAAPKTENQAIQSTVPVLLINGEYDNETPPKWAIQMQKNLPNSYHLIFKGWKHTPTTNWSNNCAMQAANAFFNDPNTCPLPDCFQEITLPDFDTKQSK